MALSVTGFFLVTKFVLPIFASRYFYILSGAGIVFLASLATLCKNKKVPALILAALMSVTFFLNAYSEMKIVKNSSRDALIADVTALGNGDPVFIHFYEETLGVAGYYFPECRHFVSPDTFTVLQSYDVFGIDYTYLDGADDIWNYTDECYIFSSFDFELYDLEPISYYLYYFKDQDHVNIEHVGNYPLPYTNEIGYGVYDVDMYRVTYNSN